MFAVRNHDLNLLVTQIINVMVELFREQLQVTPAHLGTDDTAVADHGRAMVLGTDCWLDFENFLRKTANTENLAFDVPSIVLKLANRILVVTVRTLMRVLPFVQHGLSM